MDLTPDAADDLVSQIETLIRDSTPANDRARDEIAQLVRKLHAGPGDRPYVLEKLGALESWSSIYFSPRKHQRYGGADSVRQNILGECFKLRMMFRRARGELERQG